MTNLTQDESKLLTAISGGEWVRIDDRGDVTGISRIHTIVQGMADRGMVEVSGSAYGQHGARAAASVGRGGWIEMTP